MVCSRRWRVEHVEATSGVAHTALRLIAKPDQRAPRLSVHQRHPRNLSWLAHYIVLVIINAKLIDLEDFPLITVTEFRKAEFGMLAIFFRSLFAKVRPRALPSMAQCSTRDWIMTWNRKCHRRLSQGQRRQLLVALFGKLGAHGKVYQAAFYNAILVSSRRDQNSELVAAAYAMVYVVCRRSFLKRAKKVGRRLSIYGSRVALSTFIEAVS